MIHNIDRILQNIEFSEEDIKNIGKVAEIVEKNGYAIIDSVIDVLSRDPAVVEILKVNNLSVPNARDAWFYWLKLLFFSNYDEEFFRKISAIGMTHVDANVGEATVIETTFLFLSKTVLLLRSSGVENYFEISNSVGKLFTLSLIIMVNSYREELIQSFLGFTGLSEKLFFRDIKDGRKKRREASKPL